MNSHSNYLSHLTNEWTKEGIDFTGSQVTTVPHKTNQNNPMGSHTSQSSKPEESSQTQGHLQQLPLRSQKSWKKGANMSNDISQALTQTQLVHSLAGMGENGLIWLFVGFLIYRRQTELFLPLLRKHQSYNNLQSHFPFLGNSITFLSCLILSLL